VLNVKTQILQNVAWFFAQNFNLKKKHFSKPVSMRVLILALFFWEKNVLGHIGIFEKSELTLKIKFEIKT
jgi:hypothetical protein